MRTFLSTLRSLARKKVTVTRRENELFAVLNRVLPSIGYKIVRTEMKGSAHVATQPVAPPAKTLACPHCDRCFAKPLHLGRHVSVAHKNGRQGGQRSSTPSRRGPRRASRERKKAT